jgi:hypothetical protein
MRPGDDKTLLHSTAIKNTAEAYNVRLRGELYSMNLDMLTSTIRQFAFMLPGKLRRLFEHVF